MAPKAFSEQEFDRFIDGLPVKKETPANLPQSPAPKTKKPTTQTGMGRGNG
jgi:hypothetical protein